MKRVTKINIKASKVGFTLLEVVLSIAIMLILTTMMMNGFAATMSYSYHTSVFATTAASNYATAIGKVANNSSQGKAAYQTLGLGYSGVGASDVATINFKPQGAASIAAQDISIQLYRENGGAGVASTVGFQSQKENYGETADGTYANNRTAFYYYPKYNRNGTDETTRGHIEIWKFGTEYWWYDTVHNTKMLRAY